MLSSLYVDVGSPGLRHYSHKLLVHDDPIALVRPHSYAVSDVHCGERFGALPILLGHATSSRSAGIVVELVCRS